MCRKVNAQKKLILFFGCWPPCWVCRKVNAQKKLVLFFGCWRCWVCRKVNAQKNLICFFFWVVGLVGRLGR